MALLGRLCQCFGRAVGCFSSNFQLSKLITEQVLSPESSLNGGTVGASNNIWFVPLPIYLFLIADKPRNYSTVHVVTVMDGMKVSMTSVWCVLVCVVI